MARIIDVVSHPNVLEDELVWREPQGGNGDFRMGRKLLFRKARPPYLSARGQALDVLGPGSPTLSTGNIPILAGLVGLVTNGQTPFTAEVYFINLKDMPQVGWGTNPPIQMDTPDAARLCPADYAWCGRYWRRRPRPLPETVRHRAAFAAPSRST